MLRLVAALLVLVSHSYVLAGDREPGLAGESLGGLGVLIFFAISGYLVARSWSRDPRLRPFVGKRMLRLIPGLAVMLLVTAFVIGPIASVLALGDYFGAGETWRYLLDNLRFDTAYGLPGVFDGNPEASIVNGALWTLPVEAKMYALIALLGALGLLRSWPVAAGILLVLAASVAFPWTASALPGGTPLRWINGFDGARLAAVFLAASVLYLLRRRIPLHPALLAVALALVYVGGRQSDSGARLACVAPGMAYATVFLAYRTPAWLRRIARPGDASYGIYIYGYVIQQALVAATGLRSGTALMALSVPLSYAVGLASWRLVEAPALRLKRRLAVSS